MKINELLGSFEIYTTIEEQQLLDKLQRRTKLSSLPEREQQVAENLIRKSLLKKIGYEDPDVVVNEKY
jgi:FixJ family two-component response regulator